MRVIRRIAILIAIVLLSPVLVAGFAFQVARNWFEFGRAYAELAEDEFLWRKANDT